MEENFLSKLRDFIDKSHSPYFITSSEFANSFHYFKTTILCENSLFYGDIFFFNEGVSPIEKNISLSRGIEILISIIDFVIVTREYSPLEYSSIILKKLRGYSYFCESSIENYFSYVKSVEEWNHRSFTPPNFKKEWDAFFQLFFKVKTNFLNKGEILLAIYSGIDFYEEKVNVNKIIRILFIEEVRVSPLDQRRASFLDQRRATSEEINSEFLPHTETEEEIYNIEEKIKRILNF